MHWCGSYKGSKWGDQTAPPGKHLTRRYLSTPHVLSKGPQISCSFFVLFLFFVHSIKFVFDTVIDV